MNSSTRRLMCRSRSSVRMTVLGLTVSAVLFGCVPIPYGSSEKVPNFAARLPADLLEGSEEVLVLIQTTGKHEKQERNAIDASFRKAYELKTLNQELTLTSYRELGLVSWGYGIDLPISSTALDRICVLPGDGRVITLAFASGTDQIQALDLRRRKAIASALRGTDPHSLETVDGPCGMTGTIAWDKNLRSRIAEYIGAYPVAALAKRSALEDLLAAESIERSTTLRRYPRVMVLVQTGWHGAMVAEPPIFPRDVDFEVLKAAIESSTPLDIIRNLPSYSSGTRDLGSISLERFCAVTDDGHAIRLRVVRTWDVFDTSPLWAREGLKALRGGREDSACIPNDVTAWSATERRQVIAFLQAVHVTTPAEVTRAEAMLKSVVVGPEHASSASFLLVAVAWTENNEWRTVPLFLGTARTADLVDAVRSISPAELATIVASLKIRESGTTKGFSPHRTLSHLGLR
jgi:hypothetical protein